jgi:hypothetical protein
MASLRNLAISPHRLSGATNIAKVLRHHVRNALRPLQLLEIIQLCRPPAWRWPDEASPRPR